MDSKSLSHTKWKCQYHIVFIPKYRKKKLFGQLRLDIWGQEPDVHRGAHRRH